MIIRKLSDSKPNILIFQGSPRKEESCANQTSKSEKLVKYIYDKWSPFANIEVIDLSIGDITIQPCKGCVSTSNGMHCHLLFS
jgi:Leucine-rich repeat (LRR) protein